MAGAEAKTLISLGTVAVVYAFVCHVRLTAKAGDLARKVSGEIPDVWNGLNPVARSWNGGHPALKLLHRRGSLGPAAEREYADLRSLEIRMLRGIAVASACIALLLLGARFRGWTI